MEIKNQQTGKMVRFGTPYFKQLLRKQKTTNVTYFDNTDINSCIAATARAQITAEMSKANETSLSWLNTKKTNPIHNSSSMKNSK